MKKLLIILAAALSMAFFTGCAQKGYTQADVGEIQIVYKGTVTSTRTVSVKDSGEGMILGAIVGGILGHQIGEGKGKDVATVAGAVAGGVVGSKLAEDTGQEVTISLENGQTVTTVIKVDKNNPYWLRPGDRVAVYVKGNKIVRVAPIISE
ncbi:glycine zipper 2TM domain-containing protein [Nitrosophilus alvini]|uniref:glycine zipper 2TM domain-containing protein n=1 Tax=Nitrosophilus alvini TaxID=2714855 RepID=UPI00190B2AEB|nr:glycine zipper 2TM domain-containing protein [Nitrosophilus alvini]